MLNYTTKRDSIFGMRLEESPDLRERTANIVRFEELHIRLQYLRERRDQMVSRFPVSGLDVGKKCNGLQPEGLGDLALSETTLTSFIANEIAEGFGHVARFAIFAN